MLSPTLAFAEARTLCTDLAALYTGSKLSLHIPGGAEASPAAWHYDELVRTQLVLTLPSVPSKLPAPSTAVHYAELDASTPEVPELLRMLLQSLAITLQGSIRRDPHAVLTRSWYGGPMPLAFSLRDERALPAEDAERTPLTEPGESTSGVRYDSEARAWRVEWWADVAFRT